jgi:hypothetical protein
LYLKISENLSDTLEHSDFFQNPLELKSLTTENPLKQKVKLDDGITEEAAKFIKELGLINPGEGGAPVELPQNLSEDIQRRIKEGYDTQHFNGKRISNPRLFMIKTRIFSLRVVID